LYVHSFASLIAIGNLRVSGARLDHGKIRSVVFFTIGIVAGLGTWAFHGWR
jgi:hypothetical protein